MGNWSLSRGEKKSFGAYSMNKILVETLTWGDIFRSQTIFVGSDMPMTIDAPWFPFFSPCSSVYRSCSHQLAQWIPDFKLGSTACYSAEFGPGSWMWECLFSQEEFIGVKSLALPSVLANICRPVMGTVSVLSFGKVGENRKKKWRKYGEYLWSILVLPSFCTVSQCSWRSCHHLVSRQASGEDWWGWPPANFIVGLESLWGQPTSRGTGDFDLTCRGRARCIQMLWGCGSTVARDGWAQCWTVDGWSCATSESQRPKWMSR